MIPTFFNNLHDEAMALLIESRDYIQDMRNECMDHTGGDLRSVNAKYVDLSVETMRLTSRLTQVMAWMLAQRAVSSGEISAQEGASERFRLSGREICLEHEQVDSSHIPLRLCDLLQRSYDLYLRVCRLEEQITRRLAMARARDNAQPEHLSVAPLQLLPAKTSDQDPRSAY